ncbi:hypothetical protein ES705_09354 [subsurface metagenome]
MDKIKKKIVDFIEDILTTGLTILLDWSSFIIVVLFCLILIVLTINSFVK